MKTTRRLVLFGLFFLINGLFLPFAEAHGTGHRVIRNGGTITVESFYSDQEPMAYANTMIYGPLDRQVEFQNGRTDRNGRFAFFPDQEGIWRVEVSDGMGHLMKTDVDVKKPDRSGVRHGEDTAVEGSIQEGVIVPIKAAFGLSLIANIALAFRVLKMNRERSRPSSSRS